VRARSVAGGLLDGAWLLATLLTAAAAALLPVTVALPVALLAVIGLWRPLAWPLLAVGAAPLWLQAGGVSGLLGPAPAPAGSVGAAVLGAALLLTGQPAGRGVRGLVLAVGLVQALRLWLVSPELPAAPVLAGPLAVATVLLAGAAGAPAGRRRLAAGVLLVAATVHLGRAWSAAQAPPASSGQVQRLARSGMLGRHVDLLAARPALGLAAVAADPLAPRPALDLLAVVGPERLIDVGWRPEDVAFAGEPLSPAASSPAALSATDRRQLALALERQGRGGAALRLLRRGRADPVIAWTWLLLARDQGAEPAVVEVGSPPTDTPRLPGRIVLSWSLLTDGARQLDFHLDAATPELVLDVRGQSHHGPPRLRVSVDAGPELLLTPGDAVSAVAIPGPFAAGPHRLHAVFDNDLRDDTGDRNVWVEVLSSP